VHNDRGAPMTASGFVDMLAQLGVERSKSRPRVSNDNPFSESCFKTIKYQPDYPRLAHA
jgi:putative transposase